MSSKTKQVAFRLTDEELSVLDRAGEASGVSNRTEALRVILKQWSMQSAPWNDTTKLTFNEGRLVNGRHRLKTILRTKKGTTK